MFLYEYFRNYVILNEYNVCKNSEVFEVFNKIEKKTEVIKILKNDDFNSINIYAYIATTLNHPNILTATSEKTLITPENNLCKVLTYKKCDLDLFDFVESNLEKMDKKQQYYIFKQMVSSVQYLHDRGLAHCDIKLENFLVEKEGVVNPKIYLIDFENVCTQKNKKAKGYNKGSSLYLSPEATRYNKGKIDAKAVDIWALGITFHTFLTGYFPFKCRVENESEEEINDDDEEEKLEVDEEEKLEVDEEDNFLKININHDLSLLEIDLLEQMLTKNPKKRINIAQILDHPIFYTFHTFQNYI
eukprot:TRINITY_DN3601_c0_g1_i1.p1 TRINITY_DN3601_c0_g1~~TRINITY_DN3601_c0_g1_i1.p1  ORF type:complete len:301 (+),score=72.09 TRINITY_DN3601_c0_g1_i1:63-965(+)